MERWEILVTMAESLDELRLKANALDSTAPQDGVYGDVASALKKTLVLLVGTIRAEHVYTCILDGCTVREAFDK